MVVVNFDVFFGFLNSLVPSGDSYEVRCNDECLLAWLRESTMHTLTAGLRKFVWYCLCSYTVLLDSTHQPPYRHLHVCIQIGQIVL